MNKIFVILGLGFITLLSACSLEEEPISEATPDTIYSSASGIEDGVNGVYSVLRELYGTQQGFTLNTFGTDIFQHGKDGGYKAMDYYSVDLNSSLGYIEDIWTDCYMGINAANTVLDRIESVESISESEKETFKAEVRFLRAHYYYWLTLQFGDVVLRETETQGVNTEDGRTDKEVIWQLMKEDTEFAVETLDWSSSDYGRITKGAALHQLARILLLTQDYAGAEAAAAKVINEGPYQLLSIYADVFEYDNQENDEIIFSTQYTTDALNNGSGNTGHLYFTPAYDKFDGLVRDLTQGGRPYTRFRPTEFYRNLFDANDSRFDVTFRSVWFYNDESSLPAGATVGDTVIWEIEDGVFSKVAPNNNTMHWGLKKHDDPTRASYQDTRGFRDFFVFRLSETYLLAAEAAVMQGNAQEAADYLNVVRSRAAKENTTITLATASDMDMDAILDERARELGGECMRWMDLARTGKLVERVKAYNENGSASIESYHTLRPIPQAQIDLTTIDFPQNDGY
ncbi:RagB/SusD family nutrient uptake outer membrane protein [Chondrinema litorale]|uniref:RagB/SusD family nutrient uptake outer membrane protein n=1 Tax=Chondrinema litorale TaxID=2994555 RepID=UPI0025434BE0|nr:RagB/SusD family nutrient uptake outer membrane protein [Chondrinema litorale]UZR96727.1 RagB/SusD family nutrient uptake outer membrane protein [Chondrinema litorale]